MFVYIIYTGVFHGRLKPGQETTVNSYEGHTFFFTETKDNTNTHITSITASQDQVLYIIRSEQPEDELLLPEGVVEDTKLQEDFMTSYFERTGKSTGLLVCIDSTVVTVLLFYCSTCV
jgi:hypothetical protein